MEQKIIISGCSYSYGTISYGNVLRKSGYDVKLISFPGQSNDSIIYKIYKEISKNNLENVTFICQLTWLHRASYYHTSSKKWIDYQPNFINVEPKYDEVNDDIDFKHDFNYGYLSYLDYSILGITKQQFDEMMLMYKTYLKYHYEDNELFNYMIYKIDTLKSYVESTGNKIKFIYWPTVENNHQLTELKNRNFLNIDGEYSILKWSTKNKLLDGSSHLSTIGHEVFSKYVKNQI